MYVLNEKGTSFLAGHPEHPADFAADIPRARRPKTMGTGKVATELDYGDILPVIHRGHKTCPNQVIHDNLSFNMAATHAD